jgi:hypothetical protein
VVRLILVTTYEFEFKFDYFVVYLINFFFLSFFLIPLIFINSIKDFQCCFSCGCYCSDKTLVEVITRKSTFLCKSCSPWNRIFL